MYAPDGPGAGSISDAGVLARGSTLPPALLALIHRMMAQRGINLPHGASSDPRLSFGDLIRGPGGRPIIQIARGNPPLQPGTPTVDYQNPPLQPGTPTVDNNGNHLPSPHYGSPHDDMPPHAMAPPSDPFMHSGVSQTAKAELLRRMLLVARQLGR